MTIGFKQKNTFFIDESWRPIWFILRWSTGCLIRMGLLCVYFSVSVVGRSLIGLTAANKLLIDGLKCCGKPEGQEKTQLALLRGERYWKIASGQGRRAVLWVLITLFRDREAMRAKFLFAWLLLCSFFCFVIPSCRRELSVVLSKYLLIIFINKLVFATYG